MKKNIDEITKDLSKQYSKVKGFGIRIANYVGLYPTERMINNSINNTGKLLSEVRDLLNNYKQNADGLYKNDNTMNCEEILISRYKNILEVIEKEIERKNKNLETVEKGIQNGIKEGAYNKAVKEIVYLVADRNMIYNKMYDVCKMYLSDSKTGALKLKEAKLILSTMLENVMALYENGMSAASWYKVIKNER